MTPWSTCILYIVVLGTPSLEKCLIVKCPLRCSVSAEMAVIAKTYEEKCEVVYKLAYERLFGVLRQREPSLAGYGTLLLDTHPTP